MYITKFSLSEAVIHVDKYFNNLILKDLLIFLNKNKESNFRNDTDLCSALTRHMSKYNIIFDYMSFGSSSYISDGGLGIKGDIILFCSYSSVHKWLLNIFNSEKAKELFINDFSLICKHELIHRVQRSKAALRFKPNKTTFEIKNEYKYFSQIHEIMAYAYQFIEDLRLQGFTDEKILKSINEIDIDEDKQIKILNNYSAIFEKYYNCFKIKNPKIFNIFLKYIYVYLKEPQKVIYEQFRIRNFDELIINN